MEKLLRVCVAVKETGAAAFLKARSGRRAEDLQERWRCSDLVAWRNPRLTADMMPRVCKRLLFRRFLVSIGYSANEKPQVAVAEKIFKRKKEKSVAPSTLRRYESIGRLSGWVLCRGMPSCPT